MPTSEDASSDQDATPSQVSDPSLGDLSVTEMEVFATYEAVLTEHYEDFLGPTSMVFRDNHESHSSDIKVNIHLYPATEDRPFLTMATCGMGLRKMNVHDRSGVELRDATTAELIPSEQSVDGDDNYSRAELILYLPEDWDFGDPDGYAPIQLLVSISRYPHRNSTWLGPGHTVPNGASFEPFFEGSLLSAAYFLPPVLEDPGFYHVDLTDDVHLHMLWLQPITVAERHVKRLRGSDELNRLLIGNEIIDLDIDRACTVMNESRAQRRARERAQRRRRRGPRDRPWDQLVCEECLGTLRDAMSELETDEPDDDDVD